MAGLVEGFRGLAEEKHVNALANLPLLIPEGGIESEFSDSLQRLVEQARDGELEKLLEKEKSEGLNKEERALLPKLLAGR
jgi:DNA primase